MASAAYNAGIRAVQQALHSGANPDTVMTNKNYGQTFLMSWINRAAAALGFEVA